VVCEEFDIQAQFYMCDMNVKGSYLNIQIRTMEEYKDFVKNLIDGHKSPNYSLDVVITKGDEISHHLMTFDEFGLVRLSITIAHFYTKDLQIYA
jgi:hypothetical protein